MNPFNYNEALNRIDKEIKSQHDYAICKQCERFSMCLESLREEVEKALNMNKPTFQKNREGKHERKNIAFFTNGILDFVKEQIAKLKQIYPGIEQVMVVVTTKLVEDESGRWCDFIQLTPVDAFDFSTMENYYGYGLYFTYNRRATLGIEKVNVWS